MNYDKLSEEPDKSAKATLRPASRILLLVLTSMAAGAGVWYYRPQNVNREVPTASNLAVSKQVWEIENRLRELTAELAKLPGAKATLARVSLLEQALATQRELIRLQPGHPASDSLAMYSWQTKLDDAKARIAEEAINNLEVAAESLQEQKRTADALDRLKEALIRQKEVNSSGAGQALKNFSREERIGSVIMRLEAEPLHLQVQESLERARVALEARRWPDALTAFRQAREGQDSINRLYRRTQYADLAAIERIDAEIASLTAAGLYTQVEENLRQARAAAAAGRGEEAAPFFQRTADAQRLLNQKYAKSRFVSLELLDSIEAERQTALAAAQLQEIRGLDATAAAHLRRRELFQAQKILREALDKLDKLLALLPKSQGIDEELRLRLGYLSLRQEELVKIQDQTYDLLVPLAGKGSLAMLRTELPQSLFTMVMNSNPSRNVGRNLPADSVTYAEAQEYCRRASWALGTRVRLPTEEEFRAATGLAVGSIAAGVWTVENSNGQSQPTGQKPPNNAGYQDLLGNLNEWLAAEVTGAGTAPLAGGSYLNSREELAAIPLERGTRTERMRTTGFRIVVETDSAQR